MAGVQPSMETRARVASEGKFLCNANPPPPTATLFKEKKGGDDMADRNPTPSRREPNSGPELRGPLLRGAEPAAQPGAVLRERVGQADGGRRQARHQRQRRRLRDRRRLRGPAR